MTPGANRIAFNDEVTDWAVRAAQRELSRGRFEKSMRWGLVAARTASTFGIGSLTCTSLEHLLISVARSLPSSEPKRASGRRRWLHVLSEAFTSGGHTALVARWAKLDSSGDRHYLALTFQETLAVESLSEAIRSTGGDVTSLGHISSLTERAATLRRLAYDSADVVVLHIHPWDVVACAAFGVSGGPPVLLLNHADHAFWIGVGVADAVINLRASGEEYAQKFRGVARHLYLPVPLDVQLPVKAAVGVREKLRSHLGIPLDAPVALTIGSEFKYTAVAGLDFLAAAQAILRRVPRAYLIAVGPRADSPSWRDAGAAVNGRLIAVGLQDNLARYHAAADVYLEGFPFGSLTAMLEAALEDLPIVRAPRISPPPFTSDGEALDHIYQPAGVTEYVVNSSALLIDSTLGRRPSSLSTKVAEIHGGDGWRGALARMGSQTPMNHELSELVGPSQAPRESLELWAEFLAATQGSEPVWFARTLADKLGLSGSADRRLGALLSRRAQFVSLYRTSRIATIYRRPFERWAQLLRRIFALIPARGHNG